MFISSIIILAIITVPLWEGGRPLFRQHVDSVSTPSTQYVCTSLQTWGRQEIHFKKKKMASGQYLNLFCAKFSKASKPYYISGLFGCNKSLSEFGNWIIFALIWFSTEQFVKDLKLVITSTLHFLQTFFKVRIQNPLIVLCSTSFLLRYQVS